MSDIQYFSRNALLTHGTHTREAWIGSVPVYEVDLDALPRTDFTPEQQAMHAERMALYWAAEFDRLAPCLGGHPARESETVRMRAVIEAMRPIVEAALTWMDTRGDPPRATPAGDLRRAVVANRERLAIAMSAWENSGTVKTSGKR